MWYTIHSTVCKHVHFVHMATTGSNVSPVQAKPQLHPDNITYFSSLLATNTTEREQVKIRLQEKLQELKDLVTQCDQTEAINTAYKHVNAATTMLQAVQARGSTITLIRKRSYPPNLNHESQQRYFSTKKRRTTTTSALSKPTIDELNESSQTLFSEEPAFCAVCFKKNDTTNNETIDWIQCSVCSIWIHQMCLKTNSDRNYCLFVCHYCTE